MKRFLSENGIIVLLVVLVVLVLVLAKARQNKTAKMGEVAEIKRRIAEDIGARGVDIQTLTAGVNPDGAFAGQAQSLAKEIRQAKSWMNDDEAAVYAAFGGKNIRQVAAIGRAFSNQYGENLDEFLRSFLDNTEYNNVISLVRQNA